MGAFDQNVTRVIGEEAKNLILESVRGGKVSAQKIEDVAFLLGQQVGGSHKQRMQSGGLCDDAEVRKVLGDWYTRELHELEGKDEGKQKALMILIKIFENRDINLNFLATGLRKFLPVDSPADLNQGAKSFKLIYFELET